MRIPDLLRALSRNRLAPALGSLERGVLASGAEGLRSSSSRPRGFWRRNRSIVRFSGSSNKEWSILRSRIYERW
jgi:hypothetical protein